MQIIRTRKYQINLLTILQYIAKDKVSASRRFQQELDKHIHDLVKFPYKHRASIYFDDDNIRDLIYKKYTIVYAINTTKNCIEVLHIFNRNKPKEA